MLIYDTHTVDCPRMFIVLESDPCHFFWKGTRPSSAFRWFHDVVFERWNDEPFVNKIFRLWENFFSESFETVISRCFCSDAPHPSSPKVARALPDVELPAASARRRVKCWWQVWGLPCENVGLPRRRVEKKRRNMTSWKKKKIFWKKEKKENKINDVSATARAEHKRGATTAAVENREQQHQRPSVVVWQRPWRRRRDDTCCCRSCRGPARSVQRPCRGSGRH